MLNSDHRLSIEGGFDDAAVAAGSKNWLFAGSEGGGRAAAIAFTLVETAKLNGVDPQAFQDGLPKERKPATIATEKEPKAA